MAQRLSKSIHKFDNFYRSNTAPTQNKPVTMKAAIIFACLLAVAFARPETEIVKQDSDVGAESYSYNVETSDGTQKQEAGQLQDIGKENEAISVTGSYSWVDEKTGEKFTVTYVADKEGFKPSGAHLPVAPEA
uniref:Larval cuticle protein 5 n=1 Tax=Zeugodacus cucurbitae TaxID=28588 RepID=A0A0A1X826_ZEUCU